MIKLNKVGVEIDGKVYELYKMSFGFQRRMIELQTNLEKLQANAAEKYGVTVDEVTESEKVPNSVRLEIASKSLEIQDVFGSLFVNPDEARILDNFDAENIAELVKALK